MRTTILPACLAALLVTACGSVGNNKDGGTSSDATADAPTDVVATANVDAGARVTWTAPSGTILNYEVTGSPGGGNVTVVGTQALVTGLTVGQTYSFTVAAVTSAGTGPISAPSNTIKIVAGPAAPAGFIACGADSLTNLNATTVTGAFSYNVYFDTTSGVSKLSPNKVSTSRLPFQQTGVTNLLTYYYVITAVDSNGIESADSTADSTIPDSTVHDSLFAMSYSVPEIEIIDCLSKYPNHATPFGRDITGASTNIQSVDLNNIAVDPQKALIYFRTPSSILVFSNATTATGNIAPVRTITSSSLTDGRGMAIDTTLDLLYVANSAGGSNNSIVVFSGASTASGNVTPFHTIAGAATLLSQPNALAFDSTNDRLFIADTLDVLVFDSASMESGNQTPQRKITISGTTVQTYGVAVDATNDLLYISSMTGAIYSVTASTASGATTPIRTITGLATPTSLSLVKNHLFMTDEDNLLISEWDSGNTANGTVAPDTSLTFPMLTSIGGFAYVQ